MAFKMKNPFRQTVVGALGRVGFGGNLSGGNLGDKGNCTGKDRTWVPAEKDENGKVIKKGYCAFLA